MRVGIVYDPIYLKHETGEHVENSGRLLSIKSYLEQNNIMPLLTPISPRLAKMNELTLVHQSRYIKDIQSFCTSGGGYLDLDTVVSARSYEVALCAVGGAMRAAESVMQNEVDSVFALIRPPGHHAVFNRAMGFCLFNNIAITAKDALSKYGLERLAIIDFDVHHGNGTQDAFYADPRVLYVSTHQSPLFPGTGHIEETGSGPAKGTNINIPLPPGCGDAEFKQAFEQVVAPAIERFRPQLLLVSAGYDAHWADTISQMQLSVNGFADIVGIIKRLASELCSNRLVFMLEGGYNLRALAASIQATFEVLLEKELTPDPLGSSATGRQAPDIGQLLKYIKQTHDLA